MPAADWSSTCWPRSCSVARRLPAGSGGVGGTVAGVFVLFIAFNLANLVGLPFHAQLALKGTIIIAASAAYQSLRRVG